MVRRSRRGARRGWPLIAVLVIVAALAVVPARQGHPGVPLSADLDRPTAPNDLAAPTVGPPLYQARNTDGEAGSGPVAVAYHDGQRTITDATIAAHAPDPRLFHTGYGGCEPTIGITKDGTIFFEARNSNADPGVVRSRDSGLTWQNINPPAHKVSLDPYLWVDTSTGRIFDSDIDPTVTCPPLSYSDDQGVSWKTSLACGQTDHQSQFGGPPPAAGA